jgi:hypothetical protein
MDAKCCEFVFKPEYKGKFLQMNEKKEGDWQKLFQLSEGYIGSVVIPWGKSPSGDFCYRTLDFWDKEKDFYELLGKEAISYKKIDREHSKLFEAGSEREIGWLDNIDWFYRTYGSIQDLWERSERIVSAAR